MSGLASHCGPDEHCITCGDEAEPMRVLGVDAAQRLALCEDRSGSRRSVEIELVEPVSAGDRLLVHADVALTNLGETT
jgi:hydrogenase maturation factor